MRAARLPPQENVAAVSTPTSIGLRSCPASTVARAGARVAPRRSRVASRGGRVPLGVALRGSEANVIASPPNVTGTPRFTTNDVARAVSGDRVTARRLLAELFPVIRVRVLRVLWRYRSLARRRDLAQEADDLAQDVLVHLFEDGGRVLRAWDPDRGLELIDFVGFVADRTAAGMLKSGKRTPWRDDPVAPEDFAAKSTGEASAADLMLSRELGDRVYLALRAELTPLGATLFQRLFVEESPVESVCASMNMSRDAVYAWRSRLARRIRELVAAEDSEPSRARKS